MIRTAASWQWPSCTQGRTLSFRCDDSPEIVSMRRHQSHSGKEEEDWCDKTSMMINPAYELDDPAEEQEQHSCSLLSESLRTAAVAVEEDKDEEAIVRSLRSNGRLFFEPQSTSSIVKMKKKAAAFDGATALAIDSADPYGDFRRSMEEMVMSHGINDWGWLEEMLGWYLSANGRNTHGLIVAAFADLLVALAAATCRGTSSPCQERQTLLLA